MLKLILLFLIVLGIASLPIIYPKYQNFNTIKSPNVNELETPQTKIAKLTLDKVFEKNHNWTATLSAEKIRTIISTGDVIPARAVNFNAEFHHDFTWPFQKTAQFTKESDLTLINLETPLTKNCLKTLEGMVFCGSDKNIEGLIFAGVDIANLANNHSGNFGVKGVNETAKLLSDNGILSTGLNGPVFKNIRGVNFAFLGYNDISRPQPGIENADEEKIKQEISQAKKQAKVVIVSFHWGSEYHSKPDKRQLDLGHLAIDAGADLVIGNHPHWIQPLEIYHGKLITYAHGNFVFDQMWSEKTKQGVLGKYTFYNNKLIDAEFLPIYIKDFGQPEFLDKDKKQTVLDEMKSESLKLPITNN